MLVPVRVLRRLGRLIKCCLHGINLISQSYRSCGAALELPKALDVPLLDLPLQEARQR